MNAVMQHPKTICVMNAITQHSKTVCVMNAIMQHPKTVCVMNAIMCACQSIKTCSLFVPPPPPPPPPHTHTYVHICVRILPCFHPRHHRLSWISIVYFTRWTRRLPSGSMWTSSVTSCIFHCHLASLFVCAYCMLKLSHQWLCLWGWCSLLRTHVSLALSLTCVSVWDSLSPVCEKYMELCTIPYAHPISASVLYHITQPVHTPCISGPTPTPHSQLCYITQGHESPLHMQPIRQAACSVGGGHGPRHVGN